MAEVLRNASSVVPMPVARRRSHEVRVGIFVILGVIAALVVLYEGTNPELFRSRQHLTAVVPDAGGLRKGDPVRMRGVNVGSVSGFRIVPGGVEVALDVDPRYPIPADSRVEIAPSSLLGEMRASIVPGKSPETVGRAATLPGSSQASISSAVDRLAGHTAQALDRLDELL